MGFNKSRWYSGGISVEGTKVRVFWYTRNGRTTLKFPGGSQKKSGTRFDQSPMETLINELVGDREMMDSGKIQILDQFWSNRLNGEHTQFWFIVEPDGELRSEEMTDQEEGMPDETLSAPFLMEVEEVYKHPQTSPLHREMLPHLIAHMAKRSPDWGWVYRKLKLDTLVA